MYLVTIDAQKCTGCGECVKNCPTSYLGLVEGKSEPVGDECAGCESCVAVCEAKAVTVQEL